jgi:hypothetical protein
MAEVTLPLDKITDWTSFHAVSAKIFGFPKFYGHNNNAWVDCFQYLTDDDGMTRFTLQGSETLLIVLPDFEKSQERQSEICAGLLECVAFVNQSYIERGEIPRLAILPR